jgi:hypothetical protein
MLTYASFRLSRRFEVVGQVIPAFLIVRVSTGTLKSIVGKLHHETGLEHKG